MLSGSDRTEFDLFGGCFEVDVASDSGAELEHVLDVEYEMMDWEVRNKTIAIEKWIGEWC